MPKGDDHDKLIHGAAKRALEPIGLRRKGRSRTWIGDHAWWLVVVEFQPSGWDKGSYLNVGYWHLWPERDWLGFMGDDVRVDGFVRAGRRDSEEKFEALAAAAARKVHEVRESHADGIAALRRIASGVMEPRSDVWSAFDAGVASGLLGDTDSARARFESVVRMVEPDVPWLVDLGNDVESRWLPALISNGFRDAVTACVGGTRELHRLPEIENPF